MIATLAIALTGLLLGAEPPATATATTPATATATATTPATTTATATATATPADDEELLRNLELIEQLELLERLELLVPEVGEAMKPPPSRTGSRLTGAGAPATASLR